MGALIRAIREARRVDRKELACQLGVSYAYLANLEYGNRPIPPRLCGGLDSALELPEGTTWELVRLANLPDSPESTHRLNELVDGAVAVQSYSLDATGALVLTTSLEATESATQGVSSEAQSSAPRAQLQQLVSELDDEQALALLAVAKEMQRTRRARQ